MRKQYYRGNFIAGLAALVLAAMPVMVAQAGLIFNGKDDSLVVETSVTNGFTITMWVKGEYKGGNLVCGGVALHFWPGSGFHLCSRDGQESGYLNWDKDLTTNAKWRHLAAEWSSPSAGDGKMKLYVDGIKQEHDKAYSGGANGVLRGKTLVFCGVFNESIGAFMGTLEDVRVYKRALTDEEIFAVYRGEGADGVTNGMAVWFPMKDKKAELMTEGDVCLLHDRSGNGNHGKITGVPVWKAVDDDEAVQKRREQIGITCEYLGRRRAECEKQRQSLAKWFEKHPEADKKWRMWFDELNCEFGWTPNALRRYDDLYAETELQEMFSESGKDRK